MNNGVVTNSALKTVYWVILLVVIPTAISWHALIVVRWLTYMQWVIADDASVMIRVSGVLVDLTLQSIYFALLISISRRYRLSILLAAYQLFIVFMFLRYGSSFLYTSIFGSIRYFGLLSPFGL
jgi:hypothetical protein